MAAGSPRADGVVGDLGGSSLELVRLTGGVPGEGVTLPLGPFALGAPGPLDPRALGEACNAVIAPLADRFRGRTFHAVGGAWRNLAIVRMNRANYPLQVVQGFEMTAAEAIETAGLVAFLSRGSFDRLAGCVAQAGRNPALRRGGDAGPGRAARLRADRHLRLRLARRAAVRRHVRADAGRSIP